MKLTRRSLAAAVLVPAARALPQTQPSASTDPLAAAREHLKNNAAVLAKVDIPMSTEPAFQFKP